MENSLTTFAGNLLSGLIGNDTVILAILIIGIAVILLALLIINFSNPESVVLSEYGKSDEFESTLRRVLTDADAKPARRANNALEEYQMEQLSGQVDKLESEVLEKDQTIADLNKKLTAAGGATVDGMVQADNQELMDKIKDLEARLYEYQIIEDDIADLSKFKAHNDELKSEIDKLRAKLASTSLGSDEPEIKISKAGAMESILGDADPDMEDSGGADLVAEFEKVVKNQEAGGADEPEITASRSVDGEGADAGSVGTVDTAKFGEIMVQKLEEMNIKPDTKEEAEVLISDLRTVKIDPEEVDAFQAETSEENKKQKGGGEDDQA